MFDCHQDERTFWRTMTPARLHALFRAYFRPQGQPGGPSPTRPQEPEVTSLAAYFMGG